MIGLGLVAPASAAQGDGPSDNANDTATTATVDASENTAENASTNASENASTNASAEQETRSGGSATSTEKRSSTTSSDSGSDAPTGPDHSDGNAGTSGTYNTAQPESNADLNDGGANGQCTEGPYCSTRNGAASMNGKGDGEATGKPCAGCVGKADNKNPQGQMPNGTDHNKGYECDENEGIGQTNPAHTGCTVTTTKTPPTTTTPPTPPLTPPGPPAVIPPGIGGVDTEVPPAVTPPVVKGVETLVPPQGVELYRPPAEAAPAQVLPGAAALPATGATSAMTALSALALGMLALGSGLLLYRRVTS